MASPQREEGHIDIANEIVDQLCRYRIPGQEWQIIWATLRKTWGWAIKNDDGTYARGKDGEVRCEVIARVRLAGSRIYGPSGSGFCRPFFEKDRDHGG